MANWIRTLPSQADIARYIGADLCDTTSHLGDDVIESALATAPTLPQCARALTRLYGQYVARHDLARRIEASDALQLAQRRARAAADERLLAGYQGTAGR
jgi:hypothetical protein